MKRGVSESFTSFSKSKSLKLLNKKGAVEGMEMYYVLPNQICLTKSEKREENALVARPGRRRGTQYLLWAPASQ